MTHHLEKAFQAIDSKQITLMEGFMKKLNTEPPAAEVQENKAANNSKYLPISFIQTKLDEIFIGMWSFEMTHIQVVINEIVGYGTLTVVHPITFTEIKRAGSAAVMIGQTSGSAVSDINAKQKNTLVKDFPHLQAECMKSAAKTLGKIFGRDLNRKFKDDYNPEYTPDIQRSLIPEDVKENIKKAASVEDLQILWDSLESEYQTNPELKRLFTSKKSELTLSKK